MVFRTVEKTSVQEVERRDAFFQLFKNNPLPTNEQLGNLGLFINRRTLSRILFMYELYQKCLNVHGVAMEFGVRWGQNIVLFANFRGMLEPFNYNRKIIGFDTFEGFPSVTEEERKTAQVGDYGVTKDYEQFLQHILDFHEAESPISHLRKYELVKGDATLTLQKYLEEHPETVIALAYFDFDLYTPTKACLQLIKEHLTKGSVIGFDEVNYPEFPGETKALKEVFGLNRIKLQRSKFSTLQSYFIFE